MSVRNFIIQTYIFENRNAALLDVSDDLKNIALWSKVFNDADAWKDNRFFCSTHHKVFEISSTKYKIFFVDGNKDFYDDEDVKILMYKIPSRV